MKSDSDILEDVKSELEWESALNGTNVHAEVANGHVILSGSVNSYPKKLMAERIIRQLAGVLSVTNDIEVLLNTSRSDADIERSIINAITWNSSVDENQVKVTVKDGYVTLEGSVNWDYQRSKARNIAEDITGVTGVLNLIKLTNEAGAPQDIKENIEAALRRNYYHNVNNISVSVLGQKAILTGVARTLEEKISAETIARSAPGISEVDNQITVNHKK